MLFRSCWSMTTSTLSKRWRNSCGQRISGCHRARSISCAHSRGSRQTGCGDRGHRVARNGWSPTGGRAPASGRKHASSVTGALRLRNRGGCSGIRQRWIRAASCEACRCKGARRPAQLGPPQERLIQRTAVTEPACCVLKSVNDRAGTRAQAKSRLSRAPKSF